MWLLGRNGDRDRCDDSGDNANGDNASDDSGESDHRGTPVGHGAERSIIGRSRDVIDWRTYDRIDHRDDVGRLAGG